MLRRYRYSCEKKKDIQRHKNTINLFLQLCHELHLCHSLW
jgi:hypothetical protein